MPYDVLLLGMDMGLLGCCLVRQATRVLYSIKVHSHVTWPGFPMSHFSVACVLLLSLILVLKLGDKYLVISNHFSVPYSMSVILVDKV